MAKKTELPVAKTYLWAEIRWVLPLGPMIKVMSLISSLFKRQAFLSRRVLRSDCQFGSFVASGPERDEISSEEVQRLLEVRRDSKEKK